MNLPASAAGDREVVEKPSQPDGWRGRGQEVSGIECLIDRQCHFLKFTSVELSAASTRIQDGQSSESSVADSHEKRPWDIDPEDVEADPFSDGAIDQGIANRQSWYAGKHQFQIHGVRMKGDLLHASQAMFVEDRIVQMSEKPIDASGFVDVLSPGQVWDPAANPMRDGIDPNLGFLGIGIGASMGSEGERRIHEIPEAVKLGQGGAVSRGPVGHGGCVQSSAESGRFPQ